VTVMKVTMDELRKSTPAAPFYRAVFYTGGFRRGAFYVVMTSHNPMYAREMRHKHHDTWVQETEPHATEEAAVREFYRRGYGGVVVGGRYSTYYWLDGKRHERGAARRKAAPAARTRVKAHTRRPPR